jgi:hypothetical protein
MKQTAVEWLIDNWIKFNDIDIELDDFANLRPLLKQAKQMEKEQIIEAYDKGEFNQGCNEDAEQYYNEKYKSE